MTADTIHLWACDETSDTGSLIDLAGGEDLPAFNSPDVITDCPVGNAREFIAADNTCFLGSATGSDESELLGSRTFEFLFRIDSTWPATTYGIICCYMAEGTPESEDENILCWLQVDDAPSGKYYLTTLWEQGASGTNVSHQFTNYAFEGDRWYHVAITHTVAASTTVEMFVDGASVESQGSLTNASSSSGVQTWFFGRRGSGANDVQIDLGYMHIVGDVLTDAEIATNARRAWLQTVETYCPLRVDIKDSGVGGSPAFQDMSSYAGENWLVGAELGDDIDARVQSCVIRLHRDVHGKSLSKWHNNYANTSPIPSASAVGPDDVTYTNPDGATPTELLTIGREVKAYTCRVPVDTEPSAADWQLIFHGEIESVSWGGDPIVVEALDLGQALVRGHIEDTIGADDADFSTVWTGGGTPPATLMETAIANLLDVAVTNSWISTDPLQRVPVASGWNIVNAPIDRKSLLEQLNEWAGQRGWICAYKWSNTDADIRLMLYEPERARTTADWVIQPPDYEDLRALEMSREDVRNVVRIVFPATAAIAATPRTGWTGSGGGYDGANELVPGVVQVPADGTALDIDDNALPDSISKYGRQFCELGEASCSFINTEDEAEAFASSVVRDLCEPKATAALNYVGGWPEVETNDMLLLAANDTHATVDLKFAVASWRHRWEGGECYTDVQLRGNPSGGHRIHLEKTTRDGGLPPPIRERKDKTIFLPSGAFILKPPVNFRATPTSTQNISANSETTVAFGTETYDNGSNFASNQFTAPANGLYDFSAYILATGSTTSEAVAYIKKNVGGSPVTLASVEFEIVDVTYGGGSGAWAGATKVGAFSVPLDKDDTVEVRLFDYAQSIVVQTSSHFTGRKINVP